MLKRYRGVEDLVTLEFSEDLAVDAAQVASGVLLARLWPRIPTTDYPPSQRTRSGHAFPPHTIPNQRTRREHAPPQTIPQANAQVVLPLSDVGFDWLGDGELAWVTWCTQLGRLKVAWTSTRTIVDAA
jgi:hypothetical protein